MKKYSQLVICSLILLAACESDNSEPLGMLGAFEEGNVYSGDQYAEYQENPFIPVEEQPVSTFSIDADGASYANVRRFIQQDHRIPPAAAVRTEELINYFQLDYAYDDPSHPIALNGEVSACPWNGNNKLIRIGIKGQPIQQEELPPSNFVFLIDVSGSMGSSDKLELLKQGFIQFVNSLDEKDRIAIVTYAGHQSVLLESTPGNEKQKIKNAIYALGSGGSTAGAEGLITAYHIAVANKIEGGNNRIILGTDGDFNVGPSSQEELEELIISKRDQGIFITVLGVGRGNLNDAMMEQIADKGNGTYEYIDKLEQLRKVFEYETSKFYAVAKDVKVQVKFDPMRVKSYRLIGYENRVLNEEDFEDDSTDAGEIGANQNITALYEIVPTGAALDKTTPTFTIDFRYKKPDADQSIPLSLDIFDEGAAFEEASDFMQFTGSVVAFSMLIRDSKYKGDCTYTNIIKWLDNVQLNDPYGFKGEFRQLVESASKM